MRTEMPTAKAYRILEAGPIVMVTTRNLKGVANVMTMGFHMMIQHEPALVGVVIGPWNHSHGALVESGECVIAVPAVELASTVVDSGNCSGANVHKCERFGLTQAKGQDVSAPLVEEC